MSKNLIIKNTIILYTQIIVTTITGFLIARFKLDTLGQIDYGIYSVIGGVLGSLMIVSNALNASTQRYLSYELGRNDIEMAKAYFNSSMGMYIVLSLLFLLIGLPLEPIIINHFLIIPKERVPVAGIVYMLVIVNLIITILSTPFYAVLNAREKMSVNAILSVISSLLMLMIAVALYFINFDKLLFFIICYTFTSLCIFIILVIATNKLFAECSYNKNYLFNRKLIKEQLSFSSWSLFGGIAGFAPNNGTNVLLNIFFGPVVNTAFSIAYQISTKLNVFSTTIMQASRPQMIKAEGAKDRVMLHNISFTSSKYSFFILYLLAFPILLELPSILDIWLVKVPSYALIFCRLIIIIAIINQITISLISVMMAIGKIALYQCVVGSILISALPIGYFLFKHGYPPESILIAGIFIAIIASVARVVFVKYYADMSVKSWLMNVPYNIFISVLPGSLISLFIYYWLSAGWVRLFTVTTVSTILNMFFIYLLGMNKNERKTVKEIILKIKNRLNKLITFKHIHQ